MNRMVRRLEGNAELVEGMTVEIYALLGYYAESCGNYLPTFRGNVSVPSSRFKSPSRKERKPATYNVHSGKYVRGSN
jgi:hypothetical protein